MRQNLKINWALSFFILIGFSNGLSCRHHHTSSQTATTPNENSTLPATVPFVFVALTPEIYVCKVKTLLTGLACTASEINQTNQDPGNFGTLISQWQKTPEYQLKMIAFFSDAFQQRQIISGNFYINDETIPNISEQPQLVQNFAESFGRTAWEIVANSQPFTDTLTTQTFMMTPVMKATYAFMDSRVLTDQLLTIYPKILANPNFAFTLQDTDKTVTFQSSIDPKSGNYLHFFVANLKELFNGTPTCPYASPFVLDSKKLNGATDDLYAALIGPSFLYKSGLQSNSCRIGAHHNLIGNIIPFFSVNDYNNWQLVTIRQPQANEDTTNFWDYNAVHNANVLVLNTPRVGFFTTPAFFANWETNSSNQHRVTINQTLIAALSAPFDGTDPTVPQSLAALDPVHAPVNTPCYTCHFRLDPMRQYFREAFSYDYSQQTDANQINLPAMYAVAGVSTQGNNLLQLGQLLSQADGFSQAWVQKLCAYANSVPCSTTDPEFIRLSNLFKANNYAFNQLIVDLFSSPIVTYSTSTPTALANQELVSIARMDHFCGVLSARLKITDACNTSGGAIQSIVAALPRDSYSRGDASEVLPTDSDLFFRAGVENICADLAAVVVDGAQGQTLYQSSDFKNAINAIATDFMATAPSKVVSINNLLSQHYTAALQQNNDATTALRSTFVLSCMSPSITAIGM